MKKKEPSGKSDSIAENIHNTTVLCCAVVDCDPFSCNDGGYSRLLRADRS